MVDLGCLEGDLFLTKDFGLLEFLQQVLVRFVQLGRCDYLAFFYFLN